MAMNAAITFQVLCRNQEVRFWYQSRKASKLRLNQVKKRPCL